MQSDTPFFWQKLLATSHRTGPEQTAGLGIYLLFCCSFGFIQSFWINTTPLFWMSYFLFQAGAMWALWRCYSLRVLKWELSLFSTQFLLQIGWLLSFQQPLLALTFLLLHFSSTLLATLLFLKKERISGQLLFLPLAWISYLVGKNILLCIATL